jgi:hypothetical protein
MLLDESRNLLNLQVTALLMFIMVKIMTHHRSDHEESCNSKIEHFACVTKAATRMKLMWKSISSHMSGQSDQPVRLPSVTYLSCRAHCHGQCCQAVPGCRKEAPAPTAGRQR